ncbi:MAG: hypothetical protein LBL92_06615, partial [Propionibacteriaceae bacterium]|nr:hypothetical protein [Propionibacteriaceae bacterium]
MNRKRCDRKALLDEAQAVKRSASQLPASARDHLGPMLNQAAEHLAPYRDEAIEQAKAAKVKAANWA